MKKLTVGLVGIIVVVLAITYIPTKYEENQKKTDQYIALECSPMIMAANSTKKQYQAPTKYFILERKSGKDDISSPKQGARFQVSLYIRQLNI